jgi:2-dehydropantoate 2-reductase
LREAHVWKPSSGAASPFEVLGAIFAHAVESVLKIEAVDLILIAVKLWDSEDVAQALRPLAEEGAAVLSLRNGVEKDEVLRRFLPTESILGGVCYISASIVSPGVIDHHGAIQRVAFGEYSGQESARTQTILEVCRNAAIDAEISLNIERLIWEKFVFLVGLSGTTTSMRQTIGSIRQNPRTRSFLLDLMCEVVDLGRSRGVDLSEDYAADRLDFCDSLPASMTSSMHADLERGNRLELPWLSGGVVRLGKDHDIRTPLNRAVSDILETIRSRFRPKDLIRTCRA